jgi:hypothetical protein
MFQVSIIEFIDRPDKPLYHLEHFIDGNYIKYNSNSGFVEDVCRSTPHAFSHFTFECSNHDLIVIDIQGVGDLYTDPQIHTANGHDYGDGNLGCKGMALFFHSHICNDVCRSLGLTPFDLSESEKNQCDNINFNNNKYNHSYSADSSVDCDSLSMLVGATQCRGSEEAVIGSPSSFSEYLKRRNRCRSDASGCSDDNSSHNELANIYESEGYDSSSMSPNRSPNQSISLPVPNYKSSESISIAANNRLKPIISSSSSRQRNDSSCLDSAFSFDEAANYFQSIHINNIDKKPSCVDYKKKSGGGGVVLEEAEEVFGSPILIGSYFNTSTSFMNQFQNNYSKRQRQRSGSSNFSVSPNGSNSIICSNHSYDNNDDDEPVLGKVISFFE